MVHCRLKSDRCVGYQVRGRLVQCYEGEPGGRSEGGSAGDRIGVQPEGNPAHDNQQDTRNVVVGDVANILQG